MLFSDFRWRHLRLLRFRSLLRQMRLQGREHCEGLQVPLSPPRGHHDLPRLPAQNPGHRGGRGDDVLRARIHVNRVKKEKTETQRESISIFIFLGLGNFNLRPSVSDHVYRLFSYREGRPVFVSRQN